MTVPKLLASDGAASDQFGQSVAVSGDTVVVGAFFDDDQGTDSGSAYVFELGPNGALGGDHFKCYEAEGNEVGVIVDLEDQFGVLPGVRVEEPELFCNPVDKNGEGISDPTAHPTCYEIDLLEATRTPPMREPPSLGKNAMCQAAPKTRRLSAQLSRVLPEDVRRAFPPMLVQCKHLGRFANLQHSRSTNE